MNQDLLELALINELKDVKRMKRLEGDLIEQFDYAFNYVMTVAERNGIALPNFVAMRRCLARIARLTAELYPETSPATKHSWESPYYEAEPK